MVIGMDFYPTSPYHQFRNGTIRTVADSFVAFSQKCTHLSCTVYYSKNENRLECPCHQGFFSIADGSVLQGPPQRPLPRVVLEKKNGWLVAVHMEGGGA